MIKNKYTFEVSLDHGDFETIEIEGEAFFKAYYKVKKNAFNKGCNNVVVKYVGKDGETEHVVRFEKINPSEK